MRGRKEGRRREEGGGHETHLRHPSEIRGVSSLDLSHTLVHIHIYPGRHRTPVKDGTYLAGPMHGAGLYMPRPFSYIILLDGTKHSEWQKFHSNTGVPLSPRRGGWLL